MILLRVNLESVVFGAGLDASSLLAFATNDELSVFISLVDLQSGLTLGGFVLMNQI